VLQRVKRTRKPVRITRFGKPVADVVPPRPPAVTGSWLGAMTGRVEITGDIVAPVLDGESWSALGR
jgi:antitoxin (DNA-binding transcriptional repressor) of toxin-antitoxin stability system